jgi:galactonate dehydratase
VRVTQRTVWSFVEAVDAGGERGLGEATLEGRHADVARAVARHGQTLVGTAIASGADAARWAALRLPGAADLVEAAAISGIEQALQDLAARRAGVPLHALLGGARRERVPMYANINRGTTTRAPAQFAERAARAAAQGFVAVKIAPFDGVTPANAAAPEGRAAIDAGLARVAAVREALGANRSVMVDCHWRLTEPVAMELIVELARLGVDWFECPLPETAERYDAIGRLRARANEAGMRLAGAETMVGAAGFLPLLRAGLYDVVMPDVKYAGGVAETLRIAEAAAAHGTDCSPHNPSGPICHVHSLHVAAVIERMPFLEVQFEETPCFAELVDSCLPPFRDGASRLPDGPGLGVRLAADAFEREAKPE